MIRLFQAVLSAIVILLFFGCESYDLPKNDRGVASSGDAHLHNMGYYLGFSASGYYEGAMGSGSHYSKLCGKKNKGAYYSGYCRGYRAWKKNPNPNSMQQRKLGYYLGYWHSGYYGDRTDINPYLKLCRQNHTGPAKAYYGGYCAGVRYRQINKDVEPAEYDPGASSAAQ